MRISGYALRLAAFCNTLTGGANLNFALRFLFPYFFFLRLPFLGRSISTWGSSFFLSQPHLIRETATTRSTHLPGETVSHFSW